MATLARASAASAAEPVNWLLVYDLLIGTQDCLNAADNPGEARRRACHWVGSQAEPPVFDMLAARTAVVSSSWQSADPAASTGDSASASLDSGSTFGGGDTGSGGASASY